MLTKHDQIFTKAQVQDIIKEVRGGMGGGSGLQGRKRAITAH